MGGQQSRRADYESSEADTDSWMNRVDVKPSPALIARLQEQQNQQAGSSIPAEAISQTSAAEDESLERTEDMNQAIVRQREQAMKREEDEDRVRELMVAKDAETAHLSKIISSTFVPDVSAGRQPAVCDQESQAVIKCYVSLREGADVRCGNFVDVLEECASNQ